MPLYGGVLFLACSLFDNVPIRVVMYNVLILEDDPVARAAMVDLIDSSNNLRVCGHTPRIKDAYQLMKQKPEFVLADLMLEDGDAFQFIHDVTATGSAKVLVLSALGDEVSVLRAIKAGADGYINKEAQLGEVERAINAVLGGEAPMSPKIARHLLRTVKAIPGPESYQNGPKSSLSKREREVLEALAQGQNYKEVARGMNLSHHTVAKYIKTIYRKLAVHSRAEAIMKGVRDGIIEMK